MGGDPYENRTRVSAVRGQCLSRLTNGPFIHRKIHYTLLISGCQEFLNK